MEHPIAELEAKMSLDELEKRTQAEAVLFGGRTWKDYAISLFNILIPFAVYMFFIQGRESSDVATVYLLVLIALSWEGAERWRMKRKIDAITTLLKLNKQNRT